MTFCRWTWINTLIHWFPRAVAVLALEPSRNFSTLFSKIKEFNELKLNSAIYVSLIKINPLIIETLPRTPISGSNRIMFYISSESWYRIDRVNAGTGYGERYRFCSPCWKRSLINTLFWTQIINMVHEVFWDVKIQISKLLFTRNSS